MEKELFVRLALCVDPRKLAASGLSSRAVRSFGIDTPGISPEEKKHREALKDKVFAEMKPLDKEGKQHIIPGLGPHPGFPEDRQLQIGIRADSLYAVAKKIVRGCEYWLANGRIIEPPLEIEAFVPREMPVNVNRSLGPYGPDYLGPGCRIRRAGATDRSDAAMYEIVIWETLTFVMGLFLPRQRKLSVFRVK